MTEHPPKAVRSARPATPGGFWVLWSTVALDQVVFSMVLPVLPFLARRYGASPLTVTALVSVFALAQFLISPFVGALSDRVGRKPLLVLALLGSAAGSLVIGFAASLPLLFIGRAVDGLSGTALVSAQASVTDMVPPTQRARFLGLMGTAFAAGFVIGPALTAMASRFGDRVPFFVAAGIGLANALVALVRLPETRPEEQRRALAEVHALGSEDRSPLAAFRDARGLPAATWFYIVVLAVGLLAFSSVEGGTFTLLADDRFGYTASTIAVVFVWVGIVLATVQVLAVGPSNARLGTRGTVTVALAANVVGFAVLAATGAPWTLWVAVALNAAGQGLLRPTCTSAVSNSAPAIQRGLAIGTQTSAQGLVRIVGPLVAGALYGGIGPGAPFAFSALLMVVAVAVVTAAGRRFEAAVA